MQPPYIFVQGLPELREKKARAWLVRANELGLAFSREVHGNDRRSQAEDATVIHVAATVLWLATRGRPCWTRLDVGEYVRTFRRLPLWRVYEASATLGLLAFYVFLVKHGYVPARKVRRIQQLLAQHAAPHVRRLLEMDVREQIVR